MSNDGLDIAVPRYLKEIGLATAEQIASAMQVQSSAVADGAPISLAEALVKNGILTPSQREHVEQKAASKHGVQQLGQFKLLRKLGEGGMGAVYLAEDLTNSRQVALKVLPRRFSSDREFLTRFRREAQAAAELRHENIAGAYDTGEDVGYHFYVMEYCEGEPLDKTLLRESALDPSRATSIILEVARGLKHAHDRGFIHRDIKPANILVTAKGKAKILDLGLSKNIEDAATSFQTVSGAVLGTPHYMSPEQTQGEKDIDGRADLYSLGATFYHLVTGQAPFSGASAMEIMYKHVHEQVPDPQDIKEDIPDGIVHIIRRLMAKKPGDRYADGAELIADLELVVRGSPPRSEAIDPARTAIAVHRRRPPDSATRRRPPTVRRVAAPPKKNPALLWGGIAAAAILAVAIAVFSAGGTPPTTVPPPRPKPPSTGSPPPPGVKAPDPAVAAQRALDELLRFDGVAEEDRRKRIELLIAFALKYDGTPAARKARDLSEELKIAAKDPFGPGPVDAAFLRAVAALPADQQIRRVVDKLKELNPEMSETPVTKIEGGKVVEFELTALGVTDITPIPALADLETLELSGTYSREAGRTLKSPLTDLSPLTGMKLRALNVKRSLVSDLSPLRGMDLVYLKCSSTQITSLEPVRDMPRLEEILCYETKIDSLEPLRGKSLRVVDFSDTRVEDLSPLADARLARLECKDTPVADLSPIRGMPLEFVDIRLTAIEDLSPLRNAPLEELHFTPRPEMELTFLREASLKKINEMAVSEFWKEFDALVAVANEPEDPRTWAKAIRLLPAIDPKVDAVEGTWTRKGADLHSDDTDHARIEIPYEPPEEYDLRVSFTSLQSRPEVNLVMTWKTRRFKVYLGDNNNRWVKIGAIKGLSSDRNPTIVVRKKWLTPGKSHTAVVRIRSGEIRVALDGKLLIRHAPNSDLYLTDSSGLPHPLTLGLLSDDTATAFHSVDVVEVTGKGSFLRDITPSSPPARPPLELLWSLLVEHERALVGKPVTPAKPDPDGTTYAVKAVKKTSLVLEARFRTGGKAEVVRTRAELSARSIVDLAYRAVPAPAVELRKAAALLLAEKADWTRAYRELDRARKAGGTLDDDYRRLLQMELDRRHAPGNDEERLSALKELRNRRRSSLPAGPAADLRNRIASLEKANVERARNRTAGLIGHWSFDEGSGRTVRDASGQHPAGTVAGPTWAAGVTGKALSFDGNDDYVDLGPIDHPGESLTLAAWIRVDPERRPRGPDWRVLSKSIGTEEQEHYWMLSGIGTESMTTLRFRLKTDGTTHTLVAESGAISPGRWTHVAAAYDGKTMKLFKDGALVAAAHKSGRLDVNPTAKVWVGGNPPDADAKAFCGLIDDVRLYRRALTDGEIANLAKRDR